MIKQKVLIYACDKTYSQYAKLSLATFSAHHDVSEWQVVFADVGLSPAQKADLDRFGTVVEIDPYLIPQQHGFVFTAAYAKMKVLSDLISNDVVLLYLDADTLILQNLDGLVSKFVNCGKPIAVCAEDIEEFWRVPASYAWRNHKIPPEFRNQGKWCNAPLINTGVILGQGPEARDLGEEAARLQRIYKDNLWLPDKAVMVSLLYDRNIPVMQLESRFNCVAWEKHITHIGTGEPYVNTTPYFKRERVVIRHFAAEDPDRRPSKATLDKVVSSLDIETLLRNINSRSARNCALFDIHKTYKTCASNTNVAVAINVFKEPIRQIRECFTRVSRNLPKATVGIFLDGVNRPEVLDCARELGFLPLMGEKWGANATWHRWWLRMFHFFSFTSAAVCFKFDPDTMVDAPPLAIPHHDYFGCMPDGYSFIQGGVTGISNRVVRIVLEKRLLEPITGEERPWLKLEANDFADDQALARMLEHIGVYPNHWSECRSLWKEPVANDPVVHAIVHPRYYRD